MDGKRAGQKVQRKIAGAVQNVKPLYFLSRSFEIREKKFSLIILFVFLIKLPITKVRDGGFREGGIREGEIEDGQIVEGGC